MVTLEKAREISIEAIDLIKKIVISDGRKEDLEWLKYNMKIKFNSRLKTTGGRARSNSITGLYEMELNEKLLLANPTEFRATVIHELCHLADSVIHGRTSGHGKRWQNLMYAAGEKPKRAHNMKCEVRRQKRYRAYCGCSEGHQITIGMLKKISTGKAGYKCRRCKEQIQATQNEVLSTIVENSAKALGFA
jgi:SprT protein